MGAVELKNMLNVNVVVVTVVTRFVRYDAYKSSLFVLHLVKFICIHLFFGQL